MRARGYLRILAVIGLAGVGGFAGCRLGEDAGRSLASLAPPCLEPACADVPLPPSPHVLRLTRAQWERTMRDLLRLPAEPGHSRDFPSDPDNSSDSFGAETGDLIITTAHWRAYQSAAESLARIVTGDPSALDRILPPAAKSGDTGARVAAFVADFLPRAYRRPVTAPEVAQAVALGETLATAEPSADPFVRAVRRILTAALQSPHALYRVEIGAGLAENDRTRLGEYELASKLSYTLWGTMPDDTITGHARSGRLATDAGVGAVARTMLADPRAEAALLDFHDRLFLVHHYTAITRQPQRFPLYYSDFGVDAGEDVRQTVREVVVQDGGGVKDLLSSTVAYVNAKLAPVYGIDPQAVPALVSRPDRFARVEMDGTRRVGLLMHAGWLAHHGSPRDPSTIRRGVFLARRVLCFSLGAPPAAATSIDPQRSPFPTNRQRVENTTKGCGDGCHGGPAGVINPLGFSLEDFDSMGQFRTLDGDLPVDTTGTVRDVGAFAGAVPLFRNLSTNPRAHACYAAHWMAYLNGTSEVDATPRWLSPVVAASLEGASVRDIVAALVQTRAFVTVSR